MKAIGTVAAYEAGKMITVKGKDKEMAFDVTDDTMVKGEVKEGTKVTVMYKKDGEKMIATSISVAPPPKKKEKKMQEVNPKYSFLPNKKRHNFVIKGYAFFLIY